ncbi:MAG: DUF892 family protein [Bacteroidia bacterium]
MIDKPQADPVSQKFNELLFDIYQLEKQLVKVYAKMEKLAFVDELRKCLSPVSTDSLKHLERLELMKPSKGKASPIRPKALPLKTPTLVQDLHIIALALEFQNQKLAIYELLHPIASALDLQSETQLIEQTITDHRNTNTWLRQIVQNIVVPKLLSESST